MHTQGTAFYTIAAGPYGAPTQMDDVTVQKTIVFVTPHISTYGEVNMPDNMEIGDQLEVYCTIPNEGLRIHLPPDCSWSAQVAPEVYYEGGRMITKLDDNLYGYLISRY